MLSMRFLEGLDVRALETFPGIFEVTDERRRGSYRFVATYADGQREKERFFAFLERHGQVEDRSRWHLHHVVEGHHFADIDFDGRLRLLYADGLPCVFIHEDEHAAYTAQARLRGTRDMYRDALPRRMDDRSRAATKEAATAVLDPAGRTRLRERVNRLRAYYRDLHAGDRVVQKLADNVLLAVLDGI